MTKKKYDELEGFVMEPHAARSRSGNRALPRVVPIEKGEVLAVYPDEETVAAMKAEGWTTVKAAFRQNDEGDYEELALIKSDDGVGINVRYYSNQRVNIHVTVKRHGVAVAKTGAGACEVRRITDAFVFNIMDQVNIGPPQQGS